MGCSWIIEILLVVVSCQGLMQGPCPTHPLYPVHVNVSKWPGDLYVNVGTYNEDARCQWVSRRIGWENGCVVILDFYRLTEKGEVRSTEVVGKYVSKGHYMFEKELIPGKNTTLHAYFLHHDPPNLDIHIVCTDDPEFKDGHYQFYCEGQYPDALKRNAPLIKKIAEKNGINVRDLMVVDNCDCPDIPYLRGPSKCKPVTVEEYFCLKPKSKKP